MFQKTVIKRFKSINHPVRNGKQGEEVQAKDLILILLLRIRDGLPRILASYPDITSEKPENTHHKKGYKECNWKPICMNDIKVMKQAVVSYGMHSPFVWKMVKTWASSNVYSK